jgi:hypothetical protein
MRVALEANVASDAQASRHGGTRRDPNKAQHMKRQDYLLALILFVAIALIATAMVVK